MESFTKPTVDGCHWNLTIRGKWIAVQVYILLSSLKFFQSITGPVSSLQGERGGSYWAGFSCDWSKKLPIGGVAPHNWLHCWWRTVTGSFWTERWSNQYQVFQRGLPFPKKLLSALSQMDEWNISSGMSGIKIFLSTLNEIWYSCWFNSTLSVRARSGEIAAFLENWPIKIIKRSPTIFFSLWRSESHFLGIFSLKRSTLLFLPPHIAWKKLSSCYF